MTERNEEIKRAKSERDREEKERGVRKREFGQKDDGPVAFGVRRLTVNFA